MGYKYRVTPQFEADLIARHPDAPICVISSMSVHIGKSEAWIIRQWKKGSFHAYEWGVDPDDPTDEGRRGKKICLQTHLDSAMACKQNIDLQTAAGWQENAVRLNNHRAALHDGRMGQSLYEATRMQITEVGAGPVADIMKTGGNDDR